LRPEQIPSKKARTRRRLFVEVAAAVVVLAAIAFVILRPKGSSDYGTHPEIAQELFDMERADQNARDALTPETMTGSRAGKEITRVDRRNTARLEEIVARYGWPGRTLVGGRASGSAWLLAQHADLDPAFQKRALTLMRAMGPGEVSAKNVAYLTDRVLVAEKKPQVYGTQLECRDGSLVGRTPVRDPRNLDRRRRSVGLDPWRAYRKSFIDSYGACP
jgi:hypothetical protein